MRGVGLAGGGVGHELGVAVIGGYQRDAVYALDRVDNFGTVPRPSFQSP